MYDVNLLGVTMYLKELDRQAAPKVQPVNAVGEAAPIIMTLGGAVVAILRRFHTAGIPRWIAKHRG